MVHNDAPERDSVAANTERSPLLGDRLGKTDNTCLGSGVVGLADIAVQAGDGRYVDDRAVAGGALRVLGAQVRGGFLYAVGSDAYLVRRRSPQSGMEREWATHADNLEGSDVVDLEHEVVVVVGHGVEHLRRRVYSLV